MKKERKKAAVAAAEDTSFNTAEFEQPTAAEIVQSVADNTHLPAEHTAAHEHGHAHRHQPRKQEGQSHAEAVGKREAGYSPAGKLDVRAGARLAEYQDAEKKIYLSIIRFDEKPSGAVIQKMYDAGFQWQNRTKEWSRKVGYETRIQDRLHAERTFDDVCSTIHQERGHGGHGPA